MREQSTKERILDSAEFLFASKGLKETSVRDITSHANVHLAAVNYHFQTKDGLLKALMDRRIEPLNRQRLELLEKYENRFGEDTVPVEYALYALLAPGIRMCFEEPHFLKITGQVVSHPDEETYTIFVTNFEGVFSRFRDVLAVSLPHISEEELMWRIHFLTGSMIHTWTNHRGLTALSSGVCELGDQQELVNKLIAFCSAGLKAQSYVHPKEDEQV
ncbi:MAG: TetR family transcriptional regulator [Thermodesulfobacteriota bacterium]